MLFKLQSIHFQYETDGYKRTVYTLVNDDTQKVLISTVRGSHYQYDIARTSGTTEELADAVFHSFMDVLDHAKDSGIKPFLGQTFEV